MYGLDEASLEETLISKLASLRLVETEDDQDEARLGRLSEARDILSEALAKIRTTEIDDESKRRLVIETLIKVHPAMENKAAAVQAAVLPDFFETSFDPTNPMPRDEAIRILRESMANLRRSRRDEYDALGSDEEELAAGCWTSVHVGAVPAHAREASRARASRVHVRGVGHGKASQSRPRVGQVQVTQGQVEIASACPQ